jgi:predicted amidophosphoribosyltransferase
MAEAYWIPDALTDYCPRCGLTVRRHEVVDGLCLACQGGQTPRPPWQRIIRLGEYEPPLSQWICEVKFTRWRKLGRDLGRLLGDSIACQLHTARAAGGVPEGPPLIVPVPMSLLRRLTRGIDHTLAVARGVADRTGGRVVQPIRRDHRPSQIHVAPSRREANVANSVYPRAAWIRPKLAGRLIVVVDDVTTTTSTLRAACRAVAACCRAENTDSRHCSKGKPAAIWAAVLARTSPEGHDGQ